MKIKELLRYWHRRYLRCRLVLTSASCFSLQISKMTKLAPYSLCSVVAVAFIVSTGASGALAANGSDVVLVAEAPLSAQSTNQAGITMHSAQLGDMVLPPKTGRDFFQNIRHVIEAGLLFNRDFYVTQNLQKLFPANTIKLEQGAASSSQQGEIWAVITDFNVDFTVDSENLGAGLESTSELSVGVTPEATDGENAFLTLTLGDGGPSFDEIQHLFADSLSMDRSRMHEPPPPATAAHGNERWLYAYQDGSEIVHGLFKFDRAGRLSSASFKLQRSKEK